VKMRAVLFADLVGSTRLYHMLGDREAHEIAAGCVQDISETVTSFGGKVVKTIGDEVMATFDTAAAACGCAEAIVKAMGRDVLGCEDYLGVHVGFHYGPVIEEDSDVFGDTVNVAAHITKLAQRQCILTTGTTEALLEDALRDRMRHRDRVAVKGREEPVEVFEVTTGSQTLIRFVSEPDPPPQQEPSFTISRGTQRHELRDRDRPLTIGRDASNDFVWSSPCASRFHARIEWRGRSFYLVDGSTNGTRVVSETGHATTVRREWMRIHGSGTFSVAAAGDRPEEPIHFECCDPEPTSDPNCTTR